MRSTRLGGALALLAGFVTVTSSGVLAPAASADGVTACPPAVVSSGTATVTCSFTGDTQTWTVPADVSWATVTLDGAQGGTGAGASFSPHSAGGEGAAVAATIPVTPGQTYHVLVGGAGRGDGVEFGGFNGGGGAGVLGDVGQLSGGGGGGSDLRQSPFGLADRLLVAGGGGGGGGNGEGTGPGGGGGVAGGAGGQSAAAGTSGVVDTNGSGSGAGGGGGAGTAIAGGAKGAAGSTGSIGEAGAAGSDGSLGSGGASGSGDFDGGDGGGGGGGYYGGGGGGGGGWGGPDVTGSGGGGGGGGSDFVVPRSTNVSISDGVHTGNGQVTITYQVPTACPAGVQDLNTGVVTVTCSFTGGDQTWQVPAGVTSETIDAFGGAGGNAGGYGGEASAPFPLAPGTVVDVVVGGAGGGTAAIGIFALGGFGGGGTSAFSFAGGGGGGSFVSDTSGPLLIAGGGGGGGEADCNMLNGGNGGGTTGGSGVNCGDGGGGATQSAGGTAGGSGEGGSTSGSGYTGGHGGGGFAQSGGGGGGGGYFGGGGGGGGGSANDCSCDPGGGGGGGSGLEPNGVPFPGGTRVFNGGVTISYHLPIPTTTTLAAVPSSPSGFGHPVTFTATVSTGGATPTGPVVFSVDGHTVATVDLSGGTASFTSAALPVGSHQVKAAYQGNTSSSPQFGPSHKTITYVVSAGTTVTGTHSGTLIVTTPTYINGAHVTGAVIVEPGGSVDIESSTIDGSLSASGAGAIRVCGSTIGGAVTIATDTGLVEVGDPADAGAPCAGNSISGTLSLHNNHHGVEAIGNTIGGLVASGNSGTGPYGQPTTIGPNP